MHFGVLGAASAKAELVDALKISISTIYFTINGLIKQISIVIVEYR